MEEDKSKSEAKSPGVTPSKIGNYQKIAARSDRIIERLFELLESRNESTALGAANRLIDKILPDLKSTELTGEDQGPMRFIISLNEDDRQRIADLKLSFKGTLYEIIGRPLGQSEPPTLGHYLVPGRAVEDRLLFGKVLDWQSDFLLHYQ